MNATTTSPPPCRPRPEDESSGPTPEVERENREWVCKQYKEIKFNLFDVSKIFTSSGQEIIV